MTGAKEAELAVRQIVSHAISGCCRIEEAGHFHFARRISGGSKHLPQRNLAVELPQKLLNNELKIHPKKYLVQSHDPQISKPDD